SGLGHRLVGGEGLHEAAPLLAPALDGRGVDALCLGPLGDLGLGFSADRGLLYVVLRNLDTGALLSLPLLPVVTEALPDLLRDPFRLPGQHRLIPLPGLGKLPRIQARPVPATFRQPPDDVSGGVESEALWKVAARSCVLGSLVREVDGLGEDHCLKIVVSFLLGSVARQIIGLEYL